MSKQKNKLTVPPSRQRQKQDGQAEAQTESKSLGSYFEIVDFSQDPIVHLFYAHIRAGLAAFQGDITGNPDAAISKYKFMLRLGETLLGEKFGFDFIQFRRDLDQRTDLSEGEKLMEEVKQVSRLLENRVRKIEIVLHFSKADVMDFAKELLAKDAAADEEDEELAGADEEIILTEKDVLDSLGRPEDSEGADEEIEVDAGSESKPSKTEEQKEVKGKPTKEEPKEEPKGEKKEDTKKGAKKK